MKLICIYHACRKCSVTYTYIYVYVCAQKAAVEEKAAVRLYLFLFFFFFAKFPRKNRQWKRVSEAKRGILKIKAEKRVKAERKESQLPYLQVTVFIRDPVRSEIREFA